MPCVYTLTNTAKGLERVHRNVDETACPGRQDPEFLCFLLLPEGSLISKYYIYNGGLYRKNCKPCAFKLHLDSNAGCASNDICGLIILDHLRASVSPSFKGR